MSIVMVSLPDAAYGVNIRAGLVDGAGPVLRSLTDATRVAVVHDAALTGHYVGPLTDTLRTAGFDVVAVGMASQETEKTIASVQRIYDALLDHRWDRRSPIVALGGGIVGDVAGFAAATILRGVPLVQMPTTLLAMVDASVGGKTGVNHRVGKNLIGAFHQPIAVLADVRTLRTLPDREFRAGLAECIKHDIIRDADGFARLEQHIHRALTRNEDYLAQLVEHNVAIKARVVAADPFEQGERAHLNFGHTFGHGIERATDYAMLHGECVALGMVAATQLAVSLGMLPAVQARRIVSLIERAGLPVRGIPASAAAVVDAMQSDKKSDGKRLRFVLPTRIGAVTVRDDVQPDAIMNAVSTIL
jgi:3-dehydroquinate synthase